MTFESAALVAAWVAILLLGFAMSGLLRQIRDLQTGPAAASRRRPGPAIGTTLDSGEGPDLFTDAFLFFAGRSCRTCDALIPELARLTQTWDGPRLVVLYREDADKRVDGIETICGAEELFENLNVSVVPFGVVTDAGRRVVQADMLGSLEKFKRFVAEARERKEGVDGNRPAGHPVHG
ncbi:MAG: hypothetical protein M3277_12515 [Actinomycetota bacterium]|nr:hypothetical protein [Actinomycetota bacterium]